MQRQNIYTGRAGEFLVAYKLELLGLRTTHVDLPRDDLWVKHPDGHIIPVQVKSCSARRKRTPTARALHYNFKIARDSSVLRRYNGIYILIALDVQLLIAKKWDDLPPVTCKFNSKSFTKEAEQQSIKETFKL